MNSEKEIDKYLAWIQSVGLPYTSAELLRMITDREELIRFSSLHQKPLGMIYQSPYNTFLVDLVENRRGERFTYERLVKTSSGNSVVIAAQFQQKYVLLKQFRHAMGEEQLAFPRGYGEPDISIEQNVRKEIQEELQTEAYNIRILGKVVADSGVCGEKVNIASCDIHGASVEEGYEDIKDFQLLSLQEIKALVKAGQINDGFTLSALAFLS